MEDLVWSCDVINGTSGVFVINNWIFVGIDKLVLDTYGLGIGGVGFFWNFVVKKHVLMRSANLQFFS